MRDEVFVRRLEAFGDIVMGFSLALLGLTLVVPNHAASLVEHPTWFAAYVWTFALVCVMWSSHYWTVRYVFVPTPLSLFVNYARLALVVLLIFMVQVLLRAFEVGSSRDVVIANELYWGCLATIWVAGAILMAIGLRARSAHLPVQIKTLCLQRIYRVAAVVPATLAGIAIASRGDPKNMSAVIAYFLVAGAVLGRVAGARVAAQARRRIPSV